MFRNLNTGTAAFSIDLSLPFLTNSGGRNSSRKDELVILDLSNYVTWSFPEFVPFCAELYYFSNLKRFSDSAAA